MNLKLTHLRSKGNNPSTMTTCQYYIKRTKNPRICTKKSTYNKQSFLGGVCPDQKTQFGVNDPEFELHLCCNHFEIISKQIRKKIGSDVFFDFRYGGPEFGLSPRYACPSQEENLAQLVSILTHCIDEFNRITQASHFAVPSVPEAALRSVSVLFIEERSENQVLARKFEEAKRDGRYIDLTEPTEQKSVAVDNLNTHFPPEDEKQEHQIDCPVCLDEYSPQNVTFLQCAHPVCNDCLTNIERRNIAQQCPVCRIHF